MVQRDLLLAEYTGGHVHIAHVSTGRAVDFVRQAKRRGVRATLRGDAAPSRADRRRDRRLRHERQDEPAAAREPTTAGRCWPALLDGTVDAIATDHAPHHADEKCVEFAAAPFGIVGLETAVALCLDRLVHHGELRAGAGWSSCSRSAPRGSCASTAVRLAPGPRPT